MSVCAVIVSYNRKALLRQCLAALRRQTRAVDQILVVDNASSDGTAAMLAEEFPLVSVLALRNNIGGAGGYRAALQWAFNGGHEWIWTLDDDSITQEDALEAMFDARDRFQPADRPKLLASKVTWTDGSLHPMNLQKPKLYAPELQILAAGCGTLSIRFTSFVSLLMHRSLIDRYGLPIAGYFMWNDDVEYTARILRNELGVMVPASIVCHKTAAKYVPATSIGGKYYYEIRNKLWLMRLSPAFGRGEKWWMAKSLARRTWRFLKDAHFAPGSVSAILRGAVDGAFKRPVA